MAQTAYTEPVGFVKTNCLAGSDTMVSLPLIRPPEFVGTIDSISSNVLTISGTPNWTTNQFVYVSGTQPKTYYAILASGTSAHPREGMHYLISANGTNSVTLDLNGDSLSGVGPATSILIVPYWTLATVFPSTDAGVSFLSSGSPFSKATEILIPNYSGTGTNLSAAKSYYFYNSAWRQTGRSTGENHNDDILVPKGYFTLRNNTSASTLTLSGNVLMKKAMLPLVTGTSLKQDNFASVMRPVDVKLNDTGLISSGAFKVSSSPFSRADELLVFDNSVAGKNKSASAVYYYYNNAWRKSGQSTSLDFGTDVLSASSGFVIRKATTTSGSTQFWQNDKTYN